MSATFRQSNDFHDALLPSKGSFLDDAISWIKANLEPGDVFSTEDLHEWAIENNYVKEEAE